MGERLDFENCRMMEERDLNSWKFLFFFFLNFLAVEP